MSKQIHCTICDDFVVSDCGIATCKAKSGVTVAVEGVQVSDAYLVMPYDLETKNKRPNWCPLGGQ
jgi:hypothetical protein